MSDAVEPSACDGHADSQVSWPASIARLECVYLRQVTPHADESITVEQYFAAECHRLIQRVRGRYEQAINTLQAEFKAQKAQLLQEAGL